MKNPFRITESDDFFSASEKDYHTRLEDKNFREIQVLSSNLKFLKWDRQRKFRILFILFLILGIPISFIFLGLFKFLEKNWLTALSWTFLGFILVLIISCIINLRINIKNITKVEGKIGILMGFADVDKEKPGQYFHTLVSINLSNLEEYYSLVKKHTSFSFTFSLIVGLLGFGLIFTGIAIGFRGNNQQDIISYISSAAGVIIEFIAGVFFFLYNRTVLQLNKYHNKLVDIQNILVANQLIDSIENDEKKVEIISKMVECLVKGKNQGD